MFYDIYLYTLCYYICCPLGACMRCTRLCPLKPGVTARGSRYSAGSPDSPVHTGHVQWIIAERIPEAGEFQSRSSLGHRTLSGVHRTVRWIIAERLWIFPKVRSSAWSPRTLSGGTPDSPVRQTRAHFGYPLLFLLNPILGLFIG
jgi:hypothetical protein